MKAVFHVTSDRRSRVGEQGKGYVRLRKASVSICFMDRSALFVAAMAVASSAALPVDLFLTVQDSDQPNPQCHEAGSEVRMNVEIGPSPSFIVGGQFLVEYDPACLDFASASPGQACDANSPYGVTLFLAVDETLGRVFYAVGVAPLIPNPASPATMACLSFRKLPSCPDCSACFGNRHPQNTILTDRIGQPIPYVPHCSAPIRTARDVVAQCPADVHTSANCAQPLAHVTWVAPQMVDPCDGPLELTCSATHSSGVDLSELIAAGGDIPVGAAKFCCSAEGECDVEACCWVVVVDRPGKLPCSDDDACTADFCEPNHPQAGPDGCVNFFRYTPAADISPPGGDGHVDVLDILCVLDGFADLSLCPDGDIVPCGGDGIINLGDILAVLDAFAGETGCPCPG